MIDIIKKAGAVALGIMVTILALVCSPFLFLYKVICEAYRVGVGAADIVKEYKNKKA